MMQSGSFGQKVSAGQKLFISEKKESRLRIPKSQKYEKSPKQVLSERESGDHHAKLGEFAARLWKEKAMTDVLVSVQTKEFRTHKAVLACYSPYFKEMLEKQGFSDVHNLQLPTVTPRAFEILLEYMYTGEVKVNCQELSEVYRSARRLGIRGAIKKCIEYLHVSPRNFQNIVYLFVTARKLNLLDASARAFKLMVRHFERVVLTTEFLDLEKNQIIELLSANEIGARSEVVIFLAALKWLHHAFVEREEHLLDVLKCIRFPLMNLEEILACYHPPLLPGVMKISDVRISLLNATCYIAAKSRGQDCLFQELSATPRTFYFEDEPFQLWATKVYNTGEYEKNKAEASAVKIQAYTRGYLTRKNLREELRVANYAATLIQSGFRGYIARKTYNIRKNVKQVSNKVKGALHRENKAEEKRLFTRDFCSPKEIKRLPAFPFFLLLGACNPEKAEYGCNSIFSYDIGRKEWERITTCPIALHAAKMVSSDEALYIVGGSSTRDVTREGRMIPIKSGYKYHFEEEEWTVLSPMNEPRSLHGAVVFQKKIFVIGGKSENKESCFLTSIEILDEVSGKWVEFEPSLPQPLCGMGAAVYDNNLWIAGGMTQIGGDISLTDAVWCYDQNLRRWCNRPYLPQPLAFGTLLASSQCFLSIGGVVHSKVDNELLSTSSIYEFKNGAWLEHAPIPKALHSVGAGISGKDIYLFGALSKEKMCPLEQPIYYDSKEQKWKIFASLPESASGYIIATTFQHHLTKKQR